MTKELLVDLLKKLRLLELRGTIQDVLDHEYVSGFSNILSLSDDEVKDVLSTEKDTNKVLKLCLYLRDNIDDEVKQYLFENLDKSDNCLYAIRMYPYLEKYNIKNKIDYIKDVVEAKETEQAIFGSSIVKYTNIYNTGKMFDIFKLVVNATAAKNAYEVVTKDEFLEKENFLSLLGIISKAKDENVSSHIKYLYKNSDLLKRDDIEEIATIVANCKQSRAAFNVAYGLRDKELKNNSLLDYINLVADSDLYYFVLDKVVTVIVSKEFNEREDSMDIAKMLITAKKDYAICEATQIILSENMVIRPDAMKFVHAVLMSNDDGVARKVKYLATSDDVLEREDALELVTSLALSKNRKTAEKLFDKIFQKVKSEKIVRQTIENENYIKELEEVKPIIIYKEIPIIDLMHYKDFNVLISNLSNDSEITEVNSSTMIKTKRKVNKN